MKNFDRWLQQGYQTEIEDPTEEELTEADRIWQQMQEEGE